MKTSDRGIDMIMSFEGFRDQVYLDQAGKETIGYGHLLTDYEIETDHFAGGILDDDAIDLLELDLVSAELDVEQAIKVYLNQNQFDALVSFTFNLGGTNLLKSTLLRRLNEGNYADAALAFAPWNKVRSPITGHLEINTGLVHRREVEALLFSEPEDVCSP